MMSEQGKKILVVVAHADDEVIGFGGTIAQHSKHGHEVHILIMADGVTSRFFDPDSSISRQKELQQAQVELVKRHEELIESSNILGVKSNHVYEAMLADQRLDQYPLLSVIKKVEKLKQEIQPDIVYTHFWNDLNIDHRITCQAVLTAFRPVSVKEKVEIFHAEIPESTYLAVPKGFQAFEPSLYMDITDTLSQKLEALKAYESEARAYPDLRSLQFIEELAELRAEGHSFKYAEAFVEISGRSKMKNILAQSLSVNNLDDE